MKAIKRKNLLLAALTCLGILAGGMILLLEGGAPGPRSQIPLAGAVVAGATAAGFWLRQSAKLRVARLIAENPILHIRTAVISDLTGETAQPLDTEDTEVIVSYFGILLGERVIKFNQGGVRIRAVQIGGDFISFTYGAQGRTQIIRLLRPAIEPAQLSKIVETFRYETGIMPTLLP